MTSSLVVCLLGSHLIWIGCCCLVGLSPGSPLDVKHGLLLVRLLLGCGVALVALDTAVAYL